MKKYLSVFAALALFFACTPEENNPSGTDEPGGGKDKTVHVTGVQLDRTSATIKEGIFITLVATVTPDNAENKSVSWSSSSDAVATVDASGKVTGVKAGSAIITATTEDGGKKATCSLTVEANLAPSVTVGAEHISAISVVLKGKANLGSSAASDLKIGFQYSKSAGIMPSNSTTIDAEDADANYNYSTGITGLDPDTKYYFRSFVRQNGQDTYGETKEFTTKALSSMLHTKEATSVSAVSACLNATLDLTDVQYKYKEFWFYWGRSAKSVNEWLLAEEGSGSISADLSELTPSNEYFFRAVIYLDGKEYEEEVLSFKTKDIETILATLDATDIEATKANLNAKLDLTDVKFSSKTYGFYCGTSENDLNYRLNGGEIKDNTYSASLPNLSHKTQYWYKAYVKLDRTTFYGEVKTFTTDVVPVESVSLDKTDYTFNTIGSTLTLKSTVLPADATDKSVEWTSDDESVATVSSSGTVKAIGNGKATITVTSKDKGKSASCVVTVIQRVTSISLDKTSITLNEGQEQTLIPTVNPSNAADKSLNWTSSDTAVATVNAEGKVTAVSEGTATITATAKDGSGKFASCSVTVIKAVATIELNKTSLVLYRGISNVTETLTATVVPSDASNTAVTWTSSNNSVATVSSSGEITGKSRGTATITVTAKDGKGAQAACEVEVIQNVTSITLNKTNLSLTIDAETALSVTILPDNANDKSVTWSSSDSSIASVDDGGKVTAKSKGEVTILATAKDNSGVFGSCTVRVMQNPCPSGAVDLGLSVYWASCNIGASKPENRGDYYAWGETATKTDYSWSTYKWGTSSKTITKYNTDSSRGTVDNKTVLELEDDVAHAKLGGKWRMPTDEEWTELITKCTWEGTTNYNGDRVTGIIFTAPNGNSVFLPCAGVWSGTNLVDSYGLYWSSSLSTDSPSMACDVIVSYNPFFVSHRKFARYYGGSVRPVTE